MIHKLIPFVTISVFALIFLACNDAQNGKPSKESTEQAAKPEEVIVISDEQLITGESVGKFRIGRSIPGKESVAPYQISREIITTTTEEGPYEETVYVLKDQETVLMHLKPEFDYETMQYNRKTGEIIVFSDQFKTEKGSGVHSTVEDFIKAYPDYKLWYTYVSGMFIIETPVLDVQFILDQEDFKGDVSNADSEITNLEISDFRKGAKIKQVRIFKSDAE